MTDAPDTAAEIRAWLIDTMAASGMSARAWAAKAGLSGTTISRAIKPNYQFVTSSRTLAKLAAVAGVDPPEVRKTAEVQIVPAFLPVRYQVQGGAWREVDNMAQEFRGPSRPVVPDPRYVDCAQWLEEVVGDSVDLLIPDGGFAHVVDAIDMGYQPRENDFVVVERRRSGGMLRERTVKQIKINGRGVELWPKSSNPKWSEPTRLHGGTKDGEEIEVVIAGKVIGAYTTFL